MKLEVTISELNAAASTIARENENLREAVNRLKQATEALGEGWTGSANDDFRVTMTERLSWYEQMSGIIDEYVASMQQTANKYTEMDREGAQIIKRF